MNPRLTSCDSKSVHRAALAIVVLAGLANNAVAAEPQTDGITQRITVTVVIVRTKTMLPDSAGFTPVRGLPIRAQSICPKPSC